MSRDLLEARRTERQHLNVLHPLLDLVQVVVLCRDEDRHEVPVHRVPPVGRLVQETDEVLLDSDELAQRPVVAQECLSVIPKRVIISVVPGIARLDAVDASLDDLLHPGFLESSAQWMQGVVGVSTDPAEPLEAPELASENQAFVLFRRSEELTDSQPDFGWQSLVGHHDYG